MPKYNNKFMLIIGVDQIVVSQASRYCHMVPLSRLANDWRHVACSLLIVLIITLGGCSNITAPVVTPTAPLYHIQPEVWQAIDEQILSASVFARQKSEAYARFAMANWLSRVRQRTEEIFIPWYSSYWTQQWMASRVAWYKMQYAEGELTPEERLTNYLQKQFYDQVLEPISKFVDPHTVMEETTAVYLREVKFRLEQLPNEHQIPVAELNRHLKFIPAIVMKTMPLQDISLYEIMKTTDLYDLPAYETLLAQINATNGGMAPKSSKDSLDKVSKRAVTKLVEQMKLRGGASIVSLIAGGHLGVFISVGAASWSATEHEHDKSEMDAQLRDNLDVMLDMMWQDLMEDRQGGVTAVVHHISKQIEDSVLTLGPAGSGLF